MRISGKARLIGVAAAAVVLVVAIVLAVVLCCCGGDKKITSPKQYEADHGIYVTGSASYDVTGQSIALRSVNENDGGWKQLNFTLNTSAKIDDLYIVPLKAGVLVDDVILSDGGVAAELQSQFAKTLAAATFDGLESLKKSYGFQPTDSQASSRDFCLKAEDTASKLLYFIKDGKIVENTGITESDLDIECESYGISVWVNYEWSGTDYDNLFYIGINEVEQDITA